MSTSSTFAPCQAYTDLRSTDYCVVAFGIVLIISLLQWVVDGRKNFTGPRVSLDELSQGVTIGQAPLEPVEDYNEETKGKTALN